MSSKILIAVVAIVILVIFLIIFFLKKKNNIEKETPASILDVNDIGVSENNHEFSYGYEKEETIVMQPVNTEKEEEKIEDNVSDKTEVIEKNIS